MAEEPQEMQKRMHALGLEQIVVLKTMLYEIEQYELACIQAKPEKVLEDHRLKCEVALANYLDKKRELAELVRKWSTSQTNRKA